MDVKLLHSAKTARLIVLTELPIVKDFIPVQVLNAFSPMSVTESGITTDAKFWHAKKQFSPIDVIVFGMSNEFKL